MGTTSRRWLLWFGRLRRRMENVTFRTRGASHGRESRNLADSPTCCTVRMTRPLKRRSRDRGRSVMHVSERLRKVLGLSLASSTTASNTSVGSLGWMDMSAGARVGWGGGGILGEFMVGNQTRPHLLKYSVTVLRLPSDYKVSKYAGARRLPRCPSVIKHIPA